MKARASSEEQVTTVEQARTLSLKKWIKVMDLQETLFDELDRNCGFCDLGRHRAKEKGFKGLGCEHCGVNDRCTKIQREGSRLETQTRDLIERTIKFLEDMKVTEND